MRTFILSLLCIAPIILEAQIEMSNNCKADLITIHKTITKNQNQVTPYLRKEFAINKIGAHDYLSLLAQVNNDFNSIELEEIGILVGAQIKNIVSLKYPVNQLALLETLVGIDYLQIANKISPSLNKVLYDTKVDSVHGGFGLPSAFTGKDVLIGITDWGFDYTQPMFYDTLFEETRILAAWDQFKTAGPHPDGYAYGTEYSTPAELIAAGSDTANIYSYGTHGTHVGGIAGGSGAGTIYRGVAFESQFLFATFLVDEGAVLDAWQWMYDKSEAGGKRLVINMSWGLYFMGALDGTSLLSQALDAFSDLGVVFVTSGGNNGGVNFHIKKTFETDTLLTRLQFYEDPESEVLYGQSITGWGEVDQSFKAGLRILDLSNALMVESPWYDTEFTDTYVDSFLVVPGTTDSIFFNLSMDDTYPTNDRPQMRLRVKSPPGSYRVVLKSTAESGTVHYWNVTELTSDVGNWGMPFLSIGPAYTVGDNLYGIGIPACSKEAISVAAFSGSYETGSGTILGGGPASFSSVGPLITEVLKPDIAAPGVLVTSSISSYTDAAVGGILSVDFEGREYPFARFSGTSMSSPAVAGITALMLEANPYLSPWQVKTIIIQTAREDAFTGVIPAEGDPKWGWGKINAYAAVKKAIATVGWSETPAEPEWSIYPNPASQFIYLNNLPPTISTLQIIDLNGKISETHNSTNEINISHLPSGIYILRIVNNQKVEQRKFIVY